MKLVTIIDYGSGNLHSIAKAFEKEAKGKGFQVLVSNKVEDVKRASHIVLPGVGAFGNCVAGLAKIDNMMETLRQEVIVNKKPFLGICVGMQMLADVGLEHGNHKGLGWIKGQVVPIESKDLKIPHMGWNDIIVNKKHPIMDGINTGDSFYFVHSYHFKCQNEENILSQVEYGLPITAVIANDNIVAAQFHPEKSQEKGLRFISNFLNMVKV